MAMAAAASSSVFALECGSRISDVAGFPDGRGAIVFTPKRTRSRKAVPLRAVLTTAPNSTDPLLRLHDQEVTSYTTTARRWKSGGGDVLAPVSPEKLDEWMRESVPEIVKRIEEAPFLVHVFADRGRSEEKSSTASSSSTVRLEREPAVPGCWSAIRRRWEEGGRASRPDGVILVEELRPEEDEEDDSGADGDASATSSSSSPTSSSSRKKWGVLVQGRGGGGGGGDCAASACYILNTCRVRSSLGASTHFCLVRAKCFGDAADVQLKKAWLLK